MHHESHSADDQEEGPFTFAGEILALDLVNTVVVVRGKQRDLLQTPEDLAHWWEAAQRRHPAMDRVQGAAPVYDVTLLTSLKTLRDALRPIFTGVITGQPTD